MWYVDKKGVQNAGASPLLSARYCCRDLATILFLSNYLSTTYNESTHMIGDTTHIAYTYIYQSLQFKTYNSTEVRGIILAADV